MSTTLIKRTATATLGAETYDLNSGEATLDSGDVPYAKATAEIPLVDESVLEDFDPIAGARILLEASIDGGTPRGFDLGLRERTVSHDRKRITLQLASDEMLLQDFKQLTLDTGARAHEGSLRDVCDYVLDKIGAGLESGTDDADVTAYWRVVNLIPDPNGASASRSVATTGASALTSTTFLSLGCLRFTAAAGTASMYPGTYDGTAVKRVRVTAGKSYVASSQIASSTGRSTTITLQFRDETAGTVLSSVVSSSATTSSGAYTRFTAIGVAPEGASYATILVTTLSNSAGQFHYVRRAMIYEGDEVVDDFDGDSSAGGGYTYAWQSTTNDSPSMRIPDVERLPDVYDWKLGVSAWDFLMTITSSAGLVLWCDEQRKWWLSLPENRVIGEVLTFTAENSRRGDDVLTRDDEAAYITGVAVRYRWEDKNGVRREAVDTAGTTEKVLTVDLDRPYPGPGAAAAILARRLGFGRVQRVSSVTRMQTTPGMSASISLPGAPDTLGRITKVTFDLVAGFMDIGTSGQIDIGSGDWLAELDATDWDDVDAALDWEDA